MVGAYSYLLEIVSQSSSNACSAIRGTGKFLDIIKKEDEDSYTYSSRQSSVGTNDLTWRMVCRWAGRIDPKEFSITVKVEDDGSVFWCGQSDGTQGYYRTTTNANGFSDTSCSKGDTYFFSEQIDNYLNS